MSKAEDISSAIGEVVKRFGTIHVLVNNAGGVQAFASFNDLTDDDWLAVLNLNLMSAVRSTRAVLPYMQQQKWGRIINIPASPERSPMLSCRTTVLPRRL
jgi:3-oxoacyl-[acyl-carrier protein] reductase